MDPAKPLEKGWVLNGLGGTQKILSENSKIFKQYNKTSEKRITLRHDYYIMPEGTKGFLEETYGSSDHKLEEGLEGSNLIIISEQLIHNLKGKETDGLMAGSENTMRKQLMPYLKKLTRETDTTVIFLDCEHVEVPAAPWGTYKTQESVDDKNLHMDRWNSLLKELVPDLTDTENTSNRGRIFRISANMLTARSPIPNKTLTLDGVHLGVPRFHSATPYEVKNLVPPQSVMVDINIMLNLICNRYLEEISFGEVDNKEEYCCSNV